MKTNEFIRADVFIIPNASFKYEGSLEQKEGCGTGIVNDLNTMWHVALPKELRENKEFKNEDWIEVWYVTPGNDESNWGSHHIDGYSELKGWKPRTDYLPKSLFEGKKEGDCITFDLPIVKELDDNNCDYAYAYAIIKIQLCLAQTKYRYRNFGTFEEVLKRV